MTDKGYTHSDIERERERKGSFIEITAIINLRLCPVRDPSPAPPMDADFSSLFSFFALSLCACRFEVTVTLVSLPPFVSPRGLFYSLDRLCGFSLPFLVCCGVGFHLLLLEPN